MKKYMWQIASLVMLTTFAAEGKTVKANVPAPVVKSEYAEPYDFRDVKLGITLSEFRKFPPVPTRKQTTPNNNHEPYADFDILVVCTGDSEANDSAMKWRVKPYKGTIESGGTKCVWAYRKDPKGFLGQYEIADILLGEYVSSDYGFYFIKKPGDTEPVLYSIEIDMAANDSSLVTSGLTKKFGNPKTESVNMVQNRMGAKFDSINRIWENDSSKIVLEQRTVSIYKGILVYKLKSHTGYVNELLSNEVPKM